MGLDTYLMKNKDTFKKDEDNCVENIDYVHFRKYYGFNDWLQDIHIGDDLYKGYVDKDKLILVKDEMSKYVDKMLEYMKSSITTIENIDDMWNYTFDIDYDDPDYQHLMKLIKPFNKCNLDYDKITDSIWNPVNSFLWVYTKLGIAINNNLFYWSSSF